MEVMGLTEEDAQDRYEKLKSIKATSYNWE